MAHLLFKNKKQWRRAREYGVWDRRWGGRGDTSINIECLPLVVHLLLMISQKEYINNCGRCSTIKNSGSRAFEMLQKKLISQLANDVASIWHIENVPVDKKRPLQWGGEAADSKFQQKNSTSWPCKQGPAQRLSLKEKIWKWKNRKMKQKIIQTNSQRKTSWRFES